MNVEKTLFEIGLKQLYQEIGKPYNKYFADGAYEGCFYPIYKVYPFLLRYKLPSDDPSDCTKYGYECIIKHAHEITKEELKRGDVLATMLNRELHVALYLGNGEIIHVARDLPLELSKRKAYFRERLTKYYRLNRI